MSGNPGAGRWNGLCLEQQDVERFSAICEEVVWMTRRCLTARRWPSCGACLQRESASGLPGLRISGQRANLCCSVRNALCGPVGDHGNSHWLLGALWIGSNAAGHKNARRRRAGIGGWEGCQDRHAIQCVAGNGAGPSYGDSIQAWLGEALLVCLQRCRAWWLRRTTKVKP